MKSPTTVSQTSLITIPNSTAPSKPIKPNISTPEEREEMSLEEMSLEGMEEKLQEIEEKLEDLKEKLGIEIQQLKEISRAVSMNISFKK